MALGDGRIYAATSATHNAVDIASKLAFGITTGTTKVADPGVAGSPGQADEQVTDRRIEVTVIAMDPAELMGLVEDAAANFVGGYVKEAGGAGTVTIKNVKFNDPPQEISFPAKDGGGSVQAFSITGRAQWGASDTWALMMVYA